MDSVEDSPTTEVPEKRTSEHFGDSSIADITFVSNDGVHFYIQKKYIEATTGGFPPSEFDTREAVSLEESSETLELLFQFMHPQRPPVLAGINFEILAPLAEAAEKYEVFSAMGFCHIEMKNVLLKYPAPILVYAAKHGYSKLVDDAAPILLDHPMADVAELLPQSLVLPWVRYYGEWIKVLQTASNFCPISPPVASFAPYYQKKRRREEVAQWEKDRGSDILARCLMSKVGSLRKLDQIKVAVQSEIPTIPLTLLDEWYGNVLFEIRRIPIFSTFL